MRGRHALAAVVLLAVALVAAPAAFAGPIPDFAHQKLAAHHTLNPGGGGHSGPGEAIARNFKVLGHEDFGLEDSNGDVWVHGNFAYVGTWGDPCSGRGVKIVDVSNLREPEMIGTLAAREGTSAEDMVVRRVSVPGFSGDLIGVGIQRCGEDPALDGQTFGLELWNVTNPFAPVKLGELGLTHGDGGVHELDLFQRGNKIYALVATPFSEFFDPVPGGDFRIIDVTNPRMPVQVGEWGAFAHGLTPGPFYGQGSFGATYGHSARASADGTKAYVSYWDLGVLTFDISDVTNPTLVSRTQYPKGIREDGDGHSVTEWQGKRRHFLLQNDEDFDPRSPAIIRFRGGHGVGTETPGAAALWLERGHGLKARVVMAANEGCEVSDYPADTPGKIAVARTPVPFYDPEGGPEPLCLQQDQDRAAAAAGAAALVHDFISTATSPQWFDYADPPVDIPVLFTDHATAQGMVAAGKARLRALKPTWGFLRIFDSTTGRQLAKFDDAPNVRRLPAPTGSWSIHNTEVIGDRAYSSWYSNGIVALDLRPLNHKDVDDPKMVGQFVPEGAPSPTPANPDDVAVVWGVAIRPSDNVVFASDMNGGLWIVRPTGRAAP